MVTINASDLTIGNHGSWRFSAGGVLTLHGNETFQINGADMTTLERIVIQSGTMIDVSQSEKERAKSS